MGWNLVVPAMILTLSGCGLFQRQEAHPVGIVDFNQPRELDKTTQPPYVVEPGDQLAISIRPTSIFFTQPTVTVQTDGMIDLEFFGDVMVAGATLQDVEQRLLQQVMEVTRRRNLPSTEPIEVAVRLVSSASKHYYVLGKVRDPGRVPLTTSITVLDAILNAGLLSYSRPEEAYLSRPHLPGMPPLILKIDWEAITKFGDTTTNYQVMPGDRIIVPGGRQPGLLGTLLGIGGN
jgi:polysaccharide export outer membrane protein